MYLFCAVCVVWKRLKLKEVGWSLAPLTSPQSGGARGPLSCLAGHPCPVSRGKGFLRLPRDPSQPASPS